MRSFSHRGLLVLTGTVIVVSLAPTARLAAAEGIVLVQDAQGHKVYVNTSDADPAPRRRGSQPAKTLEAPREINRLVNQTAGRHHVDPKLVRAIIQVESDYNPRAVSPKGAMGLMQLIPETAERFGVTNPFNPRQNIEGGVNYLKYLLNLFRGDVNLSLAAYNAGEHSVLRQGGVPAIAETIHYVRKVRSLYDGSLETGQESDFSQQDSPPVTIYRYVDASGVVHFTDGTDM